MRQVPLRSLTLALLGVCLLSSGCDAASSAAAGPGGNRPAATPAGATATAPLAAPPGASAAARLVFVDKATCCACTQARIDTSWAALQTALAGRDLPVERLHSDEQELDVQPYRDLKAFMALPALYVLDAKGGLVALLQGELTAPQIAAALGAAPGPAPKLAP